MSLTIQQHNQIEVESKNLLKFTKEDIIEIYAEEILGEENINREARDLFNELWVDRYKVNMIREIIDHRKDQLFNAKESGECNE